MTNTETRTTTERRRADIFREICREIRRAERAAEERRRQNYKPARTRRTSTTTTRRGNALKRITGSRGRGGDHSRRRDQDGQPRRAPQNTQRATQAPRPI